MTRVSVFFSCWDNTPWSMVYLDVNSFVARKKYWDRFNKCYRKIINIINFDFWCTVDLKRQWNASKCYYLLCFFSVLVSVFTDRLQISLRIQAIWLTSIQGNSKWLIRLGLPNNRSEMCTLSLVNYYIYLILFQMFLWFQFVSSSLKFLGRSSK